MAYINRKKLRRKLFFGHLKIVLAIIALSIAIIDAILLTILTVNGELSNFLAHWVN